MSGPTRPEIDEFLTAFFSVPNRLTAERDPRVRPWIERLTAAAPAATVLPCWRGRKLVDWYGIALDDRQFRALGEHLTAFIGPSYTTSVSYTHLTLPTILRV